MACAESVFTDVLWPDFPCARPLGDEEYQFGADVATEGYGHVTFTRSVAVVCLLV